MYRVVYNLLFANCQNTHDSWEESRNTESLGSDHACTSILVTSGSEFMYAHMHRAFYWLNTQHLRATGADLQSEIAGIAREILRTGLRKQKCN